MVAFYMLPRSPSILNYRVVMQPIMHLNMNLLKQLFRIPKQTNADGVMQQNIDLNAYKIKQTCKFSETK